MADRLKALQRIETVQKQLVHLAEVRLVSAERACRQLAEDKTRLETYVEKEGALGVPLATAALRSLHNIDRDRQASERLREAVKDTFTAAKRREKAIESVREKAAVAARREEEDRTLAEVTEVWLAANRASLR